MNNLTVKRKLWVLAAVPILTIAGLWAGLYFTIQVTRHNDSRITTNLEKSQAISDAIALLQQMNAPGNDVLENWDYQGERANLARYQAEFNRQEQRVAEVLTDDPDLKNRYEKIKPDVLEMVNQAQAVLATAEKKVEAERQTDLDTVRAASDRASAQMAVMDQACARASKALRELEIIQRGKISSLLAHTASVNELLVPLCFVAMLIGCGLTLGLSLWISSRLSSTLTTAVQVASRLANGVLSDQVPVTSFDETGQLLIAMNNMTGNLREMVGVADRIAAGDLSARIEPKSPQDSFANSFKQMIANLREMAGVADRIAVGDLSARIEPKSPHDSFANSFKQMIDTLSRMAEVADQIAAGDLSVRVEPQSPQDCFANSFKQMIANLRGSVSQIGHGSNQVAVTSAHLATVGEESGRSSQTLLAASQEITSTVHEMAGSIRQVATNTQNQSAAATETSAAIAQMVAGMRGIAQNTERLTAITTSANAAAENGQRTLESSRKKLHQIGSSMESAGQTINRLGGRAENIGKIVEAIDDIADQTNLLALNAAIEAARAGEHGLGFAVVADEVRKLAERSARSTREIGELINSIQRESRAAVEQMDQSNQTVKDYISDSSVVDALSTILSSTQQIVVSTQEIEAATKEQSAGAEEVAKAAQDLTRLIREISSATDEQTVGVAAVVRAMEQLREIIQQSARVASDLQSSSEDLQQQSDALNEVIDNFKIGDDPHPGSIPPSFSRSTLQRAASAGRLAH